MNVRSTLLAYVASIALATSAALAASAAGPQASIRLSLAHVPVRATNGGGMAVVFSDEPLLATVAINFVRPPNPETGSPAVGLLQLPSASWWTEIRWTLVDAQGNRHPIRRSDVRVLRDTSLRRPDVSRPRSGVFIVEGERPEVTVSLGQLPVGDYTISAGFLSLSTGELHFSVRNGGETPELRRAFLHHELQSRPGSYEDAKAILGELVRLEPANAGNFIQLGDAALVHGNAEDAASAYASASAIVADNKRRLVAAHPATPEEERAFARELGLLGDLQLLAKSLAGSRTSVEVRILPTADGNEYRLVDRATGRAIRVVK